MVWIAWIALRHLNPRDIFIPRHFLSLDFFILKVFITQAVKMLIKVIKIHLQLKKKSLVTLVLLLSTTTARLEKACFFVAKSEN